MLNTNKTQLFLNNLEQISQNLHGNIETINRSLNYAQKLGFSLKEILDTLEKGQIQIDALREQLDKFED